MTVKSTSHQSGPNVFLPYAYTGPGAVALLKPHAEPLPLLQMSQTKSRNNMSNKLRSTKPEYTFFDYQDQIYTRF